MSFNRAQASPELAAALDAADAADAVIAPMYRSNVQVEIKADRTPVTEADRRAEAAIRAVLGARFPDYGFYGEEGGQQGMQAECVWLVDPLDGTKSFVRDTPFFSTQIALMRRGELVLGVSSACVAGERAWAERGAGAWLNGERIRVSDRAVFADAILSTGNLKTLAAGSQWAAFGALVQEMNRVRGYGDFVHYHLLARGALDVVVESDVNILDIAALAVIVREAGGQFTDLAGHAVDLGTTSVLASNGRLQQAVLERIQFRG
ncbi:MAG: inositol-phosphate phosphatase [Proteobacteria bacterium]|jgi:histidinol-phosphatase|nr:inositol-phosphate phosphatase [Pseudomonadota bacterium]MCC6631750.1 inositol-phosphate phosphatase [Gammaproteobacteria bacterium]